MEQVLQRNSENKWEIRKTGWMLCLYTVIFTVLSGFIVNYLAQQAAQKNGGQLSQVAWEQISDSGLPYLVALGVGLLLILVFRHRSFYEDILQVNQKINVKVFFMLLCGFLAIQFIYPYFSSCLEALFNVFGLSLQGQTAAASAGSATVSMFIYTSFAAPIAEELVFRGAVLHSLKKFGTPFAMIVSSALFGIYHGNFAQGVFAFCVGLLLSYTALRFSLRWAIALHMFNNFVLGDLYNFLTANWPGTLQNDLMSGLQLICLVLSLYFIYKNRQKIRAFFTTPTEASAVKTVLTSLGLIIFTLINLQLAVTSIQQLVA